MNHSLWLSMQPISALMRYCHASWLLLNAERKRTFTNSVCIGKVEDMFDCHQVLYRNGSQTFDMANDNTRSIKICSFGVSSFSVQYLRDREIELSNALLRPTEGPITKGSRIDESIGLEHRSVPFPKRSIFNFKREPLQKGAHLRHVAHNWCRHRAWAKT